MSYEGGGSPGPAGPAGVTGATGATGPSFSGVNGAILWYDGSAVTGSTNLTWNGSSVLSGGPYSSSIEFAGPGGLMLMTGVTASEGGVVTIYANQASIAVQDENTTGESTIPSSIFLTSALLDVNINGSYGSTGQYLGSNGGGHVVWSSPNTFAYTEVTSSLEGESWLSDLGSGTFYLDYVMASAPLYSNANVQVTTINGTPNVNLGSWVVTVVPNPSGGIPNSLRIYVPILPTGPYFLSILVISLGTP